MVEMMVDLFSCCDSWDLDADSDIPFLGSNYQWAWHSGGANALVCHGEQHRKALVGWNGPRRGMLGRNLVLAPNRTSKC